nr:immunoglobulin heavy chain junction region [Macaca mulatta]MOX59601.1 immunoglobulin heavy chain junction region [Macaca mulatta]MOX62049.1 immunoglobulin heavy chain junction region [Macaca mulatta]MOX62371.1 immunoglobulin heavy chain junction region [Macaca mulatta]MOX62712.1 immunoglobulin heavy chain junction region [Macaca mulatta]
CTRLYSGNYRIMMFDYW